MNRIFFFIGIALVAVASVIGTEARGQEMTLRDCMTYAISNSTKIRIQLAGFGDARDVRSIPARSASAPAYSV